MSSEINTMSSMLSRTILELRSDQKRQWALHLRDQHSMSVRAINLKLGMTDAEVRDALGLIKGVQ